MIPGLALATLAATLLQVGRSPSRHLDHSMDSGYVTVPGGRLYYEAIGRGSADLFALMTRLGIRRASLIGLSLGGRIAIDFTLAHPDMVDRLVLAGPGLSGWMDWSGADTTWLSAMRRAADAQDSVAMAMAWLDSDYMRPGRERTAVAQKLRVLAADNSSFWMQYVRHGDLERKAEPPALGRLSEIHSPTLLLVGDRDSRVIRRIVDTLATSINGSRIVPIRGAGHMVNMERPAEFNSAVLDFLRE